MKLNAGRALPLPCGSPATVVDALPMAPVPPVATPVLPPALLVVHAKTPLPKTTKATPTPMKFLMGGTYARMRHSFSVAAKSVCKGAMRPQARAGQREKMGRTDLLHLVYAVRGMLGVGKTIR